MRSIKRTIALLLTLTMLACALPAASAAPADEITARPLKILTLGSSLAVDVMSHLWSVCHAEGLDTVLGLAYYSGCTLTQHVNFANNGSAVYRYYKNDNSATQTITQNVTMLHCLLDEDWDVIVLQQGAATARQVSSLQPALDQLIGYVDAHRTNADAIYLWHMGWAYQAGFPTAAFTAESQIEMYEDVSAAMQAVIMPHARIRGIIPSGTAIQNARSSYFGDELTRDGQHANELGKLIADYTWYAALTGTTLTELNYPMAGSETLSDGDRRVVIESVNNAVADPTAVTPSAYTPGANVHYTWNTAKSTGADNLTTLPTNVMYEAEAVRTKALSLKRSTFYEKDGPRSFVSYAMYNELGSYTDPDTGAVYRYGLPYRVISRAHDFTAIAENLWFDLAQMPELDTSGVGVVNLSMDYMCRTGALNVTDAAFSRNMRVYVSLDGESFLPGWAGVRAVKLLGGGDISASTEGLLYRIETENLLDVPGVEPGDVIRRIRIMPNGDDCRTYGTYYTSTISVNTWSTPEAFDIMCPRDEPETIALGESTMRAITVAEALRTAGIAWTTPQTITTTFPAGSAAWATGTTTGIYEPGKNYRGPVYERDLGSTRELFESSIVDGVYGANGAGFAPDANGKNTAYGMSCAIFAYNAISRVSRSSAWSVANVFGDPYTQLLGELTTADHAAYSDADITELNTPQQIYEAYALAQPGDLVAHFLTNASNSLHVRVVRSVSVARKGDGTIDPAASKMVCTEQTGTVASISDGGYYTNSRMANSYSFENLLSTGYVAFTLTDYAGGRVEKARVQAVAAPLAEDGDYTDGVHLAFCSNYRIIKYTVTLRDVTNSADLFSETAYCKTHTATGVNYESEALNALLADLPDGEYRLDLAVASGPLTSTTQTDVPVTVKSFPFIRGKAEPCMGNHDGRIALTQEYFDKKSYVTPVADGQYYTLPTGSYYLAEDIVLSRSIRINGSEVVTLCLNGHTLRGSRTAGGSTDKYYGNALLAVVGTLELCDHTGAGRVQVNVNGEISERTYAPYALSVTGLLDFYSGSVCGSVTRYGAILVYGSEPAGVFNMYGGSIADNVNVSGSTTAGGVELQGKAVFNLYDGEIRGNGRADVFGGGVDVNGGVGTDAAPVFHMYGGVISGNAGASGAGVRVTRGGTFCLYDGVISGNTAAGNGGGVQVAGGGLMRMSGGVISGNEAQKPGGGVYVYGSAERPGAFEMIAGAITSNRAVGTGDADNRGGGVAVGTYGSYDFSGGSVTGNTARLGGGIFMTGTGASMEVTYYADVSGNTAAVTGGALCATTGAAITMAGGCFAGNTGGDGAEVLFGGTNVSFAMTGGTLGAKGTANTLTFRAASAELRQDGEFTGGTVYLPLVTENTADYRVALRGGDFAGIGDTHAGVAVYGGRFADAANLLACAAEPGLGLADTGDAYFKYTLGQPAATAGDMTGDGKVNGKDVSILQRFVAGGYGVTLDIGMADLNGDGKVNGKDVTLLQRFVVGGYGVSLG